MSRPDEVSEQTEKRPEDLPGSSFDLYLPWVYTGATRFIRDFDVYSFGILLLEIALWAPIIHRRRANDTSRRFHTRLRKVAEHELGPDVGPIYREVVKVCLDRIEKTEVEDKAWFFWDVVKRLEECVV